MNVQDAILFTSYVISQSKTSTEFLDEGLFSVQNATFIGNISAVPVALKTITNLL
jgi:hypothetical protein